MTAGFRKRRGSIWVATTVVAAGGIAAWLAGGPLIAGLLLAGAAILLVAPAQRQGARRAGARAQRAPARPSRAGASAASGRAKRVLVVGAGEVAQAVARELARRRDCVVVGFAEDGEAPADLAPPLLGSRAAVLDLVHQYGVDEVIVAEAPSWQESLLRQTMAGPGTVRLSIVPSLYETAIGRLPARRVRDFPLLVVAPWERSPLYEAARRAGDVFFSTLALAATAPFCALAALAIKATSPGPVLFRQERVGKDGRVFVMLKFRTMVLDAEADGPALCSGYDDTRLTAIGKLLRKTRLDEIPQFVNVLRGDMSIIGPRPERPCFVQKFSTEVPGYAERHRIRPGITGLAQVNGSYHSSPREKLRFDLYYVYHRSVWLDACIALRTLTAMIH